MVLPDVTSAPLMPIGTTALTLGTVSSVWRTFAKSSSGVRSWSPMVMLPMTSRSSFDFAE